MKFNNMYYNDYNYDYDNSNPYKKDDMMSIDFFDKLTKHLQSDLKNTYIQIILNELPDEEIQKYLRGKKLKQLQNGR